MSELEERFEEQLREAGIEGWTRELRFHPVRRFRFDFAWPDRLFAVEIDGGVFRRGRHVRPDGFHRDLVKFNLATIGGWRVMRFDTPMVEDGTAIEGTMEGLALFGPLEEAA